MTEYAYGFTRPFIRHQQMLPDPVDKVLSTALEKGMDGIVLTNHDQKSCIQNETADAFAERYMQ